MNNKYQEYINEMQNKSVIQQIKNEVLALNQKYIDESEDHYDFWEQHIKYVLDNALNLASKYNADAEIVALGALLHDIALVAKIGTKKDHHINGANLAKELLTKYEYPQRKTERVIGCVLNHRTSKNATNIEELCVADADILAHFDNMDMIITNTKRNNSTVEDVLERCRRDFMDLSDNSKDVFKPKYDLFVEELKKKLL